MKARKSSRGCREWGRPARGPFVPPVPEPEGGGLPAPSRCHLELGPTRRDTLNHLFGIAPLGDVTMKECAKDAAIQGTAVTRPGAAMATLGVVLGSSRPPVGSPTGPPRGSSVFRAASDRGRPIPLAAPPHRRQHRQQPPRDRHDRLPLAAAVAQPLVDRPPPR